VVRVAAVGDVHVGLDSGRVLGPPEFLAESADLLLLAGDLTRRGTSAEAEVLAAEVATVPVPVIAVLGNHDFESGKPGEVAAILTEAGVRILDGDTCEVHGVGFAGVKGFCGGFGPRTLAPWGEEIVKRFVHEALDEALKLESALARLRTPSRIAVLHYAPIQATVEGEPCEIFPFLGSSRLEEPLLRYPVTAVVHGHAHHGQPEGQTRTGVPVYNVTRALLERTRPDRKGFRILEVSRAVPRETGPVLDEVARG
jgi:Icc-related predicted phosphoesterase